MRRASTAKPGATKLLQRGLRLEYCTLAWNVVGAPLVMMSAVKTDSAALAGFGLDSLIEIFASLVVVWQLKGEVGHQRSALRLIGAAFLVLAVYVLGQSIWTLATHKHASPSVLGMVWLAVTVVAMSLLAYSKQVTGRALGNPVLQSEARVTLIDAALAASVLIGVGLNAIANLWWADPIAGLVIVYYGAREGREAFSHAGDLS